MPKMTPEQLLALATGMRESVGASTTGKAFRVASLALDNGLRHLLSHGLIDQATIREACALRIRPFFPQPEALEIALDKGKSGDEMHYAWLLMTSECNVVAWTRRHAQGPPKHPVQQAMESMGFEVRGPFGGPDGDDD